MTQVSETIQKLDIKINIDINVFNGIIEFIASHTDTAPVIIKGNTLKLHYIDVSRISLFEIDIPIINKSGKSGGYHINIDDIDKIGDFLSEYVRLKFGSHEEFFTLFTKNMEFPIKLEDFGDLEDVSKSYTQLKALEYPISIEDIDPKAYFKGLEACKVYGDYIRFNCQKDSIKLNSSLGFMEPTITLKDFTYTYKEDQRSAYSLTFLIPALRPFIERDLIKSINLSVKKEYPLRIKFILKNKMEINYFLAPYIEDEEEGF